MTIKTLIQELVETLIASGNLNVAINKDELSNLEISFKEYFNENNEPVNNKHLELFCDKVN